MSENCTHDCDSCSSDCSSRVAGDPKLVRNDNNSGVKKLIAVVSGKGGVGKSLVTSLLAVEANKRGKAVAIFDADITGPSIPKSFGLTKKAEGTEHGIFPVRSRCGIDIMSVNLLLDNDTDPVIWRGPVIAGMVSQFWTDVIWANKDIMFIDMPPGTGDVPLTVFQSLPIDGIVIVTSPQELVSLIVEKALNMAKMMSIPVLGMVENMSYFECECGRTHNIFGESHAKQIAHDFSIPLLAQLPFDTAMTSLCDAGQIESADTSRVSGIIDLL